MLIGAHESTSGGFSKSLIRAKDDNCDCIQIFSKSPRSWKAKPISESDAKEFIEYSKKLNITKNVSHASYLLNLANSDKEKREKSINSLIVELKRANELGLLGVVFHPGSNKDKEKGIELISESINVIIKKTKELDTLIIIENTAGQGNVIGSSFLELKKIINGVSEKKRLGVCFDTCHAYAAGIDVKNKQEELFDEFDKVIGLKYLKCFHLNDSKFGKGENKDRHEKIGKGKLGIKPFKELVNNELFKNHPAYLETPGGGYRKEVDLLKNLINK